MNKSIALSSASPIHQEANCALDFLRDEARTQIKDAVVVCAHPDDEVIGLGGLLTRLRAAEFIYTTDGAPRDMADAARAGFTSPAAYGRARSAELRAAFRLAGIDNPRVRELPFVDKETALNLVRLVHALRLEFERASPKLIFTHAYEGGHPDHDACAFAVHHALRSPASDAPMIIEFTSYHEHESGIRRGTFLPHAAVDARNEITRELTPAEREIKRRMFECFASQRTVLQEFSITDERFRIAPLYDFRVPPHTGRLHYETFGWNWTGERWRELAQEAAGKLSDEAHQTS